MAISSKAVQKSSLFTVDVGKVEHLSTNYVTSTTIDYNLFAQSDSQPIKINGEQTLADYQSAEGECAHCLAGDPLFVNAEQANFNLQSGSPAIDAGIEEEVYQRFSLLYGLDIRVDYQNGQRPQGTASDIGAHDSTSSLILDRFLYLPLIMQKERKEARQNTLKRVSENKDNGNDGRCLCFPVRAYEASARCLCEQ